MNLQRLLQPKDLPTLEFLHHSLLELAAIQKVHPQELLHRALLNLLVRRVHELHLRLVAQSRDCVPVKLARELIRDVLRVPQGFRYVISLAFQSLRVI